MKKKFSLVLVMLVCIGVWGVESGTFRYPDDYREVFYIIDYLGKSDKLFNSIDISEAAKKHAEAFEKLNGIKPYYVIHEGKLSAYQKYCIFKILNDLYPDAKIGEIYCICFSRVDSNTSYADVFFLYDYSEWWEKY